MGQSPREANSRATNQELPCILCNSFVHWCIFNSLPLVFVLSQKNRVHTLPSYFLKIPFNITRGTRQLSWLKLYATSRKVAGSIPDEVTGFFNWPNPSSLTVALNWMPGIFLGVKGGRRVRPTTLPPSVSRFSRQNVGPPRPVTWIALPLILSSYLRLGIALYKKARLSL
jgi:hypothetical protein